MSTEMMARVGTGGVPFQRSCGFIYDTESAPGGQIHGCDGAVAPTVLVRVIPGQCLQHLYELLILLSERSGLSGGVILHLRDIPGTFGFGFMFAGTLFLVV